MHRLAEVCVDIIDQMRGPGRPVRPRVRRPARQPLLRRRAGVPHLLRPGPDRSAAAARRVPGPDAPGAGRQRRAAHALRDARPRREGRRGRGVIVRDLVTGRGQRASGPRRPARHRRVLQRLLPVDERQVLERAASLAGAPAGRALRQPLLHADPPDLHPGERRVPVEAHADVGVAAQRRPHLGAEGPRRHPVAGSDPRGRARLLPRAEVPELRQPRAARRRVPQRQDDGRRGQGRRSAQERRVPRLRRGHRAGRRRHDLRALQQPLRHVRAHHRRGPVRRSRCASTPPSTTRWAGSGSTTT